MNTFRIMEKEEMEHVNGGASLLGTLIFLLKRQLEDFRRPKL